jgi:hypothetical protein
VVGVVEDVKQDDWRDAGESIIYFALTGPTKDAWGMGSPAYVIKSPRAGEHREEVREPVKQIAPRRRSTASSPWTSWRGGRRCSSPSPC